MIILTLIMTFFLTSCSDIFGEDPIYGCLDSEACNYNSNANTSDKTCTYLDSFQELGYCDCYENILDECGQCGGNGIDSDGDNICDDVDICISDINGYNNGYYCKDMHVLQDFVEGNTSIDTIHVSELYQEDWWDNYGRLKYLSLTGLDLSYVPESISNLDSLKKLYLNNNNLETIPISICQLGSFSEVYIYCNNLTSQYNFSSFPGCIDHFTPQFCE